jgi:hypothetical protein
MPRAVIFLGPTMPVGEARQLLDADYLPPVRQGDVYAAVKRLRPAAIGIVDGYFHQVPSVWHREILWALAEGVHVFGAASMGALRAAELHVFGMRGVGRIFEAYRDGLYAPYPDPFEDDDEVAVLHGPPETGFVAVSEAMVDIRDTLARATEAGAIGEDMRDDLAAIAKAMPYRERSLARILDEAPARGLPIVAVNRLAAWLPQNRASRKRLDAAALLSEIGDLLAGAPEAFEAPFRFEPASVWHRFVEMAEAPAAMSDLEAAALDELRLIPGGWRQARRQAVLRCAAIETATTRDSTPSDQVMRDSLDRLRRAAELTTRDRLVAWARQNGLDERGLARLVRDEARLDLLERRMSGGLERAAADHLRLEGRFAALAARGLAKQRWAAESGVAGRRPSPLEAAALVASFVEDRLGERLDTPPSADALASALGFPDADAFIEALLLERMYSLANARGTSDTGTGST